MNPENTSEIKELLEQNLALNEENNRILRGLRRNQRVAAVWRIIYFGIFLYSAYIGYKYIQPYYKQAMSTYNSALETQAKINAGIDGMKALIPGKK